MKVDRVIPGGAAEAWNRQCFQGPFSSKAVVPGDRIVGINGRSDCEGMLEECRQNQLLKLFVVRGDLPHSEIPLGWCGAGVPTPIQTVQIIPVPVPMPIFFQVTAVPCGKHAVVGNSEEGGPVAMATGPEFYQAEDSPSAFRAGAPEFFPSGAGQDSDAKASENHETRG